jgi:uncharacterized protein with von Willebrand factor type A (vWA) domain
VRVPAGLAQHPHRRDAAVLRRDPDSVCHLVRPALAPDERRVGRTDRVFSACVDGLEDLTPEALSDGRRPADGLARATLRASVEQGWLVVNTRPEEVLRTSARPGDLRRRCRGFAQEIAYSGGATELWTAESGETRRGCVIAIRPHAIWINPLPARMWTCTASFAIMSEISEGRLDPMTLAGLEAGIRAHAR